MRTHVRRAAERGHADHGWLDSHHTFSFASYHDPAHMGFSVLRVINEDRVQAGRGFGTHPHRDMEIISYVIEGALSHKDTLGTGATLVPGDVQLMSAGRGIAHSEFNGSDAEGVHFLQIWILPEAQGTAPRYDQQRFGDDQRGLRLVVSPEGREGSLTIGQDVDLYRLLLDKGEEGGLDPRHSRSWIQVVKGTLNVAGERLSPGDGLAVEGAEHLSFEAEGPVEALVFDLP